MERGRPRPQNPRVNSTTTISSFEVSKARASNTLAKTPGAVRARTPALRQTGRYGGQRSYCY